MSITKILTATTLAALLFSGTASAETILLDKTTRLTPQGWTAIDADDIKFKKNTSVTLNETGQVVKGVLSSNTYLRPRGFKSLANDHFYVEGVNDFFPVRFFRPFLHRHGVVLPAYGHVRYKADSTVVFAEDGTVLEGSIDHEVILQIQPDRYGFVRFKSGGVLSFYPSGAVKAGLLDKDTLLRPVGWERNLAAGNAGYMEFKSGSYISFTEEGLVNQGAPKQDTPWKNSDGVFATLTAKISYFYSDSGAEPAAVQPEIAAVNS